MTRFPASLLTLLLAAAPLLGAPVRVASNGKIDPALLTARPSDEVDFLVVLPQQADVSFAGALATKEEKGQYVFDALTAQAERTQGPLLSLLARKGVPHRSFYIVNMVWVKGTLDLAKELAAREDVLRVEADPSVRLETSVTSTATASRTPLAPAGVLTVEPNIAYVKAPQAWALGFKGAGIVVGGLDTGYQWDHPALKTRYRGWNATTSTVNHSQNWHDSIHSGGGVCGPDSAVPCDDNDRGTHTMGTLLGIDGANEIGVAPEAKWIGCRSSNNGVGKASSYIECLEYFLAPYATGTFPSNGDPKKAPHLTIASWTCPVSEGCGPASLKQAYEIQRAAGILPVAAAGDAGPGCNTVNAPPAIYDGVATVGSLTTGTDTLANTSSRGPVVVDFSNRRKPDLTAPGTSIRSSVRGGGYATASGTSRAAPHVAGAVAILWSAQPLLRPLQDQTLQILYDSAAPIPSTDCDFLPSAPSPSSASRAPLAPTPGVPNNLYGWGRLDVQAAVALAQSRPIVSSVSPGSGPRQGGTVVTIKGANFVDGEMSVLFGSNPAATVKVLDPGTLEVETPPVPEDVVVDLTVQRLGDGPTLPKGFSYCGLVVQAMSNATGPLCAGATLQLDATSLAGVQYRWTGPRGFSSNEKSPSIFNVPPYVSGTYTVTVIGACTSASSSIEVLIVSDAEPPTVTPPNPSTHAVNQTLCTGPLSSGASLATLETRYPSQFTSLYAFLFSSATATDLCSVASVISTTLQGADVNEATIFSGGSNSVLFRFIDSSGNIGTAPGTVRVNRQGDLDLDGDVDVFDNIVMQGYIVGNLRPGVAPFNATAASLDTDGNATIDLFDILRHQAFIVGNLGCLTP